MNFRHPAAVARHWITRAVVVFLLSRVVVVAGFVLAQHREHAPVGLVGDANPLGRLLVRCYLAGHGYPRTLLIPQVNAHYGPWGFFPFLAVDDPGHAQRHPARVRAAAGCS